MKVPNNPLHLTRHLNIAGTPTSSWRAGDRKPWYQLGVDGTVLALLALWAWQGRPVYPGIGRVTWDCLTPWGRRSNTTTLS